MCRVTIVGFVVGKLRIISTAYERNAGGRDIDVAIARHFAREFQVREVALAWYPGVPEVLVVVWLWWALRTPGG